MLLDSFFSENAEQKAENNLKNLQFGNKITTCKAGTQGKYGC
jgi:hypothetical protein